MTAISHKQKYFHVTQFISHLLSSSMIYDITSRLRFLLWIIKCLIIWFSRFMTLLYRRFLTFYSIQLLPSLFRTRTSFHCSTFLTHVIITFMLYALSVHWAYCSAVVSFMFLTAGTEDLDLTKGADYWRATSRFLLRRCMHRCRRLNVWFFYHYFMSYVVQYADV